jgi:hypothetical protein
MDKFAPSSLFETKNIIGIPKLQGGIHMKQTVISKKWIGKRLVVYQKGK